MTRLFQLAFCCLLLIAAGKSVAQITVLPPFIDRPSAYLSDWQSRASTATVQVFNNGTTAKDVKIWVEFYLDFNLVAFSQPAKLPVITLSPGLHLFNGEELVPLSSVHFENSVDQSSRRAGRIPDGRICLRVHVADAATNAELAVSPDGCANIISYFPPQLIFPENNAELCKLGQNNVIYTRDGSPLPIFQWIPIVPSPTSLVTYHFAIFEVLPNQEPIAAIRGARPLFDRDLVGQTSLLWPLEYFFPEPGKFYIWSVRALDQNGNPFIQSNDGWAAPYRFSVLRDCASNSLGDTNGDNPDSTNGRTSPLTDPNGNNNSGGINDNGQSGNGTTTDGNGNNWGTFNDRWEPVVENLQKSNQTTLGLFFDNKQIAHVVGMELSDPHGVQNAIGSIEHCSNFDESAETSKWVLFACEDVVSPLDVLRLISASKNSSSRKSISLVYQSDDGVGTHEVRFQNGIITEVSFPSLSAGVQGSHTTPMIIKIKVESLETLEQSALHYIPKVSDFGISRLALTLGTNTVDIGASVFCARFFLKGSTAAADNCAEIAQKIVSSVQFRTTLIQKIFSDYLHRNATASEANAFIAQLNGTGSLDQIRAYVIGSAEYFNAHSANNSGFINAVYSDLLHRAPSTAEITPFLQSLNSNTLTRQAFAQVVISSAEYHTQIVIDVYNQFLHRTPSSSESATWTTFMNNGKTYTEFVQAVLSSKEYFDLGKGDCLAQMRKDLNDNSYQASDNSNAADELMIELSGNPLPQPTISLLQQWKQSGESRSLKLGFASEPGALHPFSFEINSKTKVKNVNTQTSSGDLLCGETSHF